MYEEDKKYHMDLRENARGRFLKLSETFSRGNSRDQVFIPADGMVEFQQNLQELFDEYDDGSGNPEETFSGPQNKRAKNTFSDGFDDSIKQDLASRTLMFESKKFHL